MDEEVTVKHFLAELTHQLRVSTELPITTWELADFLAKAYAKCREEERRLLTKHSKKGSCT